ncbi:hypothetical protein MVES_002357 [Malassezia vespertilionis]|uniref:SH3 domain-containing protein n=1 Tax=Malassezia vespertilionis TaxID=2020962 RepID=A0A2N1JA07_9BASI|nr:hypothetical protein MVES_002357 [Malassezia vespertilionis]
MPTTSYVRSVRKYKSPHAQDLSFATDTVIRVLGSANTEEDEEDEDQTDQWYIGELLDSSRKGTFPAVNTIPLDPTPEELAEFENFPRAVQDTGEEPSTATKPTEDTAEPSKEITPEQSPAQGAESTAPVAYMEQPETLAKESVPAANEPRQEVSAPEINDASQAVPVPTEAPAAEAHQEAAPTATAAAHKSSLRKEDTPVESAQAHLAPSGASKEPVDPSRISLRDRIAAFDKPVEKAPPPIPRGKPGGWKRPALPEGSAKPPMPKTDIASTQTAKAVPGGATQTDVVHGDTASFSASDAQSSIKTSLKERMAALRRGEAETKRPAPEPPRKLSRDAIPDAPKEEDEQVSEEEATRKAALLQRMARLGGQRLGPFGCNAEAESAKASQDTLEPDQEPAPKEDTEELLHNAADAPVHALEQEAAPDTLAVPRRAAPPRTKRAKPAVVQEAQQISSDVADPGEREQDLAPEAQPSAQNDSDQPEAPVPVDVAVQTAPTAEEVRKDNLARNTEEPTSTAETRVVTPLVAAPVQESTNVADPVLPGDSDAAVPLEKRSSVKDSAPVSQATLPSSISPPSHAVSGLPEIPPTVNMFPEQGHVFTKTDTRESDKQFTLPPLETHSPLNMGGQDGQDDFIPQRLQLEQLLQSEEQGKPEHEPSAHAVPITPAVTSPYATDSMVRDTNVLMKSPVDEPRPAFSEPAESTAEQDEMQRRAATAERIARMGGQRMAGLPGVPLPQRSLPYVNDAASSAQPVPDETHVQTDPSPTSALVPDIAPETSARPPRRPTREAPTLPGASAQEKPALDDDAQMGIPLDDDTEIPFKKRAPDVSSYALTKALRTSLQLNFGDAASGTIKKLQLKCIAIDKHYILQLEAQKQRSLFMPQPSVLQPADDWHAICQDDDMGIPLEEEDTGALADEPATIDNSASGSTEVMDETHSITGETKELLRKSRHEIMNITQ